MMSFTIVPASIKGQTDTWFLMSGDQLIGFISGRQWAERLAALPELLEAAEALLRELWVHSEARLTASEQEAVERLRMAVARVTGGEP